LLLRMKLVAEGLFLVVEVFDYVTLAVVERLLLKLGSIFM